MEWHGLLSEDLVNAAYRANQEMAWSRADAISVIELLKANAYVVLGVDVWLPTRPGPTIPTPFVYDWQLRAGLRSGNYPNAADEFVRTFKWAPSDESHRGMEPVFNITAKRLES